MDGSKKARSSQNSGVFNKRASSASSGQATGGTVPGGPSQFKKKNRDIYSQYGLMGQEKGDKKFEGGRGGPSAAHSISNDAANPTNDWNNVTKQGAF